MDEEAIEFSSISNFELLRRHALPDDPLSPLFWVWGEATPYTFDTSPDSVGKDWNGSAQWNCLLFYVRNREQAEWNARALCRLLETPVDAYLMEKADVLETTGACYYGVAIFIRGHAVPGGSLSYEQLLPFFRDEAWTEKRARGDTALGNLNGNDFVGTERKARSLAGPPLSIAEQEGIHGR